MKSFTAAVALFAVHSYGLNLSIANQSSSDGTVPDEVKDALITLSKSNHGFKDLVALNTVTEALKSEREGYESESESSASDEEDDVPAPAHSDEYYGEDIMVSNQGDHLEGDYDVLDLDVGGFEIVPELDDLDKDFGTDDIEATIDGLTDEAFGDIGDIHEDISGVPEITKIDIPYEDDNSTLFMSLDKADGVLSFLNIPNLPTISTFMAGLW